MARLEQTFNQILETLGGVKKWLLNGDVETEGVYFPLNAIDLPADGSGSSLNPPPGRIRLRLRNEALQLINELGDIFEIPITAPIDEFQLGTLLDYVEEASPVDEEIQYTRVLLNKGVTISSMRTAFTTFVGADAFLRMGIYDQTDPTDPSLEPNAKVTETDLQTISGVGTVDASLVAAYEVPTTGFYWLAWVLNTPGGLKQVASSGSVPADLLPVRFEAGAGSAALPATASGLSNPGGPILLATAKV